MTKTPEEIAEEAKTRALTQEELLVLHSRAFYSTAGILETARESDKTLKAKINYREPQYKISPEPKDL